MPVLGLGSMPATPVPRVLTPPILLISFGSQCLNSLTLLYMLQASDRGAEQLHIPHQLLAVGQPHAEAGQGQLPQRQISWLMPLHHGRSQLPSSVDVDQCVHPKPC